MSDIDRILENLVQRGLAERYIENGVTRYRTTPLGEQLAQELVATDPLMAEIHAELHARATGATRVTEPKTKQ